MGKCNGMMRVIHMLNAHLPTGSRQLAISFLLRCFHPASFKTSLHIITDAKNTLATHIIAFYGSMQTFTPITQRSLFLGLSDNKLISRSKEEY